ncbi:MAG: hypothetical protein ABI423_08385 [Burkholderiales bacterium]
MGAEAFPGGLGKINEARHGMAPHADSTPPAPQSAPLVGLIALVAHWLGHDRKRR